LSYIACSVSAPSAGNTIRAVAGCPFAQLSPVEYRGHFKVNRVTRAGTGSCPSSAAASGYRASGASHRELEDHNAGVWSIYSTTVRLATLDERGFVVRG
jgi:hypothetical protein